MSIFKDLALRIIYRHKSTSELYVQWLRKCGVRIGTHVHFYTPWSINIDVQRPWMIQIGNNVHITAGCSILQHDYSWSIIQKKTGHVYGSCGPVVIGDNVFIGQHSIILKDTHIGDNVIIGAGSVVKGELDSNAVYAGVPAKKICTLDEFITKRAKAQLQEAVCLVIQYKEVYGNYPDKKVLREFFWIFEPRDTPLSPTFKQVQHLDDNDEISNNAFYKSKPLFNGYSDFLRYVSSQE